MYADIIILAMLSSQPMHGYEIKKRMETVLGNVLNLNNKVLYPALRRFEELGAVQREVVRQDGKPDRHIYRLTDRGMEVLQGLLLDFTPDQARSEAEFLTRVAFFQLLDPPARRDILRARTSVLHNRLTHLQQIVENNTKDINKHHMRILQFNEDQICHELDWIATLDSDIGQD